MLGSPAALISRTLGVDEATLAAAQRAYVRRWDPADPSVQARVAALRDAWAEVSPHAAPLTASASPSRCPACGEDRVLPAIARKTARPESPLVVGLCATCGHGVLLEGAAPPSIYSADYYAARDPGGAGYDAYAAERAYREAKGRRLLEWIRTFAPSPPRSLLEVGSGFGYTRRAAEELGLATHGVDINPAAAAAARALYGQVTFTGTLIEAFHQEAVPRGAADIVLYQFVLEHLPDPRAELEAAAEALAAGGLLALVVPSAEATELLVFGASYRSLRSDHLHLYTRLSLALFARGAGLMPVAERSECNLHLLRGFLTEGELTHLYDSGLGPDLLFLARKDRP